MKSPAGSNSSVQLRCALIDEKKRKRMISNRESARRARTKKEQRLVGLVSQQGALTKNITQLERVYSVRKQRFTVLDSENKALMAEKVRLTQYRNRLVSLVDLFVQTGTLILSRIPEPPEAERLFQSPQAAGQTFSDTEPFKI